MESELAFDKKVRLFERSEFRTFQKRALIPRPMEDRSLIFWVLFYQEKSTGYTKQPSSSLYALNNLTPKGVVTLAFPQSNQKSRPYIPKASGNRTAYYNPETR